MNSRDFTMKLFHPGQFKPKVKLTEDESDIDFDGLDLDNPISTDETPENVEPEEDDKPTEEKPAEVETEVIATDKPAGEDQTTVIVIKTEGGVDITDLVKNVEDTIEKSKKDLEKTESKHKCKEDLNDIYPSRQWRANLYGKSEVRSNKGKDPKALAQGKITPEEDKKAGTGTEIVASK